MNFEKIISGKKVKLFIASVICGVFMTSVLQSYANGVVRDISSGVVRLHVVANSDMVHDQALKLKVRDGIIEYLEPILKNASSKEEAEEIVTKNIEAIEEEAEQIIKKYGYTYSVTVSSGNFEFPTKSYENVRLPKGNYDAIKIVIGKGRGQNWWCVLYPQLCFSKGNGTLSPESEEKLKGSVTDEEFRIITSKSNVNFKFKIVEIFSD